MPKIIILKKEPESQYFIENSIVDNQNSEKVGILLKYVLEQSKKRTLNKEVGQKKDREEASEEEDQDEDEEDD